MPTCWSDRLLGAVVGVCMALALLFSSARAHAQSAKPERSTAGEAAPHEVQEDASGVRSYRFHSVDVEGRPHPPDLAFVLRRVQSEFRLRGLGHRSFLGELRWSGFWIPSYAGELRGSDRPVLSIRRLDGQIRRPRGDRPLALEDR